MGRETDSTDIPPPALTHQSAGHGDTLTTEQLGQLRTIRRRGWWTLAIFLGVAPVSFLFFEIFSESCVSLVVAVVMSPALLVSMLAYGYSTCPRCGNLFFRRRHFFNSYARKCMNCGLRLRGRG
ncbi:MAG TPA: hypothetical protein P5081_13535 [Phycisphaerae bacterium]|nr:hypothetical protein [Phycisphaerae bacterium]HRW53899.1 hypothetical protein [Phycisphaerae bacterium]